MLDQIAQAVQLIARAMAERAVAGSAAWGAALTLFGLAPDPWTGLDCLALAGAGDTVSVVSRSAVVQTHTPTELLGRVGAAEQIVGQAGPGLGNMRADLVADATSGATAAISGGLLCLAAVAAITATTKPLRNIVGMVHFSVLVVGDVEEQLDRFDANKPDGWPQDTNPDVQFDYYSEGGRFKESLLRRDGHWVDQAAKQDIDFDAMRRHAREQAERRFTALQTATKGLRRPLPWSAWLLERQGSTELNAEFREEYRKIPWVAAAAPFDAAVGDVQEVFCLDAPDPARAYVEQQERAAGVTEVLVLDKTWYSREDVGDNVWTAPSRTWAHIFWRLLTPVPGTETLTMVDCHF